MANTTNFGWETPDDTDLVKDGAAAMRTLGNSIDASFVDLKGGTTGQVLSKNSNTDLDFTWVAQDDSNAIQNAIVDAKGDLITATAADTPSRLGVGANNTVLTADSSTATGLKWATVSAPANWSAVNSGGTSLTAASTITVSGITDADQLLVLVVGASSASTGAPVNLRFNTDSANNYYRVNAQITAASTYNNDNFSGQALYGTDDIGLGQMSTNAGSTVNGYLFISGANSAGVKAFWGGGAGNKSTGNDHVMKWTGGYYNSASTISSISVITSGNFDAGTVYIFKSA